MHVLIPFLFISIQNYYTISSIQQKIVKFWIYSDMCNLSNNIMDYNVVSQGKTTIPGVDDGEEMTLTDVRHIST